MPWRQQLRIYARPEKDILGHTNPKGRQGCAGTGGYNLIFITSVWVFFGSRRTATLWPAVGRKATTTASVAFTFRDKNNNKFPKSNLLQIEMDIGTISFYSLTILIYIYIYVFRIILHDIAELCTRREGVGDIILLCTLAKKFAKSNNAEKKKCCSVICIIYNL